MWELPKGILFNNGEDEIMKLLKTILVFIGLKIIEIVGFVAAIGVMGSIGMIIYEGIFRQNSICPELIGRILHGFLITVTSIAVLGVVGYILYALCADNWNRAKRITKG